MDDDFCHPHSWVTISSCDMLGRVRTVHQIDTRRSSHESLLGLLQEKRRIRQRQQQRHERAQQLKERTGIMSYESVQIEELGDDDYEDSPNQKGVDSFEQAGKNCHASCCTPGVALWRLSCSSQKF